MSADVAGPTPPPTARWNRAADGWWLAGHPLRVRVDDRTGAIDRLVVAADPHGMSWVSGPEQGWHSSAHGWGLGMIGGRPNAGRDDAPVRWQAATVGVEGDVLTAAYDSGGWHVDVLRRPDGDGLAERFEIRNDLGRPRTVGSLWLYVPFNTDVVEGAAGLHRRCHAHVWAGGRETWIKAVRWSGDGPHVALVASAGDFAGYGLDGVTEYAGSAVRGDLCLVGADVLRTDGGPGSVPRVVEPGETLRFGWTVFAYAGDAEFEAGLARRLGREPLRADRYVLTPGERAAIRGAAGPLTLAPGSPGTLTSVPGSPGTLAGSAAVAELTAATPGVSAAHTAATPGVSAGHTAATPGVSAGHTGAMAGLASGVLAVRTGAVAGVASGGSAVGEFVAGDVGVSTVAEGDPGRPSASVVLVTVPDLDELVEARTRFIMDRQQVTDPASPQFGAYLPYDNRYDAPLRHPPRHDYNDGRERVGMGVLLAQRRRTRPSEALTTSTDRYAAFVAARLQSPDGVVHDSSTDRTTRRLYNYPWVARFWLEMYAATGDDRYVDRFASTVRAFYANGGADFYAIGMPIRRGHRLLTTRGHADLAVDLRRLHRGNADVIVARGVDYPAHEVPFEQTIVGPAAIVLLELHLITGEPELRRAAEPHLRLLELFGGPQPDGRLYDVPIRHWDGYWFGARPRWGDVMPHHWSAVTAWAWALRGLADADPAWSERARRLSRATLHTFFPDGRASAAYVYPLIVNGQHEQSFDPLANDQDWALVTALDIRDLANDPQPGALVEPDRPGVGADRPAP